MTVTTRRATSGDKDQCLALLEMLTGDGSNEHWRETYDALLSEERGAVLVCEEDGTLLGVATISFNLAIRYSGEYCQLEELIVDSAARGKNAGGLLVQAAIEAARQRGCAEMGLYLVEHTEGNRPFYEKYGFRFVGSEMRIGLASAP